MPKQTQRQFELAHMKTVSTFSDHYRIYKEGNHMQTYSNPDRLPHTTTGYSVTVSADQVAYFNSTWPCSPIPEQDITFVYQSNGDLVDIESETDSSEFDGDALLALSHDAQKGYGKLTRA